MADNQEDSTKLCKICDQEHGRCAQCKNICCAKYLKHKLCNSCHPGLLACDDCARFNTLLQCTQCSTSICEQCSSLCTACDGHSCDQKADGEFLVCKLRRCCACEQATCGDCIIGECHVCEKEVCNRESCSENDCERCGLQTCGREGCTETLQGELICSVCSDVGESTSHMDNVF